MRKDGVFMLTSDNKRRIVLKAAGCAALIAITGLAISSLCGEWKEAREQPEDNLYLLDDCEV